MYNNRIMINEEKIYTKIYQDSKQNNFQKWTSKKFLGLNRRIPDNKRIFFHETSGRKKLSMRQSCAVESAAKHNPERPVQIFMLTKTFNQSNENDENTSTFSGSNSDQELREIDNLWQDDVLLRLPNIEIIVLDEEQYFKNSPFEEWYEKKDVSNRLLHYVKKNKFYSFTLKTQWKKSPYSTVHLSDYIRMLSLWREGGLYLDLDVLTLKPLSDYILFNFFVLEDKNNTIIPNSVFHLETGHRFVDIIVKHLSEEYDPYDWAFHGPSVTTALFRDNCGFLENQSPLTNQCEDVRLLPYYSFFPLVPEKYDLMIQPFTKESIYLLNNSWGIHMWNSKSKHDFLDMDSDQFFSVLAYQNCPLTWEISRKCK